MKNFAKHILICLVIVLLGLFGAIFYFLYQFRFETEFFIYVGAVFLVTLTALLGGTLFGLITSIFAIFLYAATYLYITISAERYFDISFEQGLWLFLYLFTALIVGKLGDSLNTYLNLHKKYPNELNDMIHEYVFRVDSEKNFDESINEEMARSRRMKTHFSIATLYLEDLPEITRVFGEKGIYTIMTKIKFYLRTVFKATDHVTQPNTTTFAVLFPELPKDKLIARLKHLDKQLENAYVEYKGTTFKFHIKLTAGIASFPEDGEDVHQLKERMEKERKELAALNGNYSPEQLKEKTPEKARRKRIFAKKKEPDAPQEDEKKIA